MSREIKFRAWNEDLKIMCDLKKTTPLAMHPELAQDGLFIPFSKHLKLMQFTGLHDKNGKEIFEGDILRVKWSIKNESPDSEWKAEEHIAGVEWSHPGWKIRWSYFSKPFEIDGNKELCWYDDYHRSNQPGAFHKLTEFEVLGNIYENPELLGGQKDAS